MIYKLNSKILKNKCHRHSDQGQVNFCNGSIIEYVLQFKIIAH